MFLCIAERKFSIYTLPPKNNRLLAADVIELRLKIRGCEQMSLKLSFDTNTLITVNVGQGITLL